MQGLIATETHETKKPQQSKLQSEENFSEGPKHWTTGFEGIFFCRFFDQMNEEALIFDDH